MLGIDLTRLKSTVIGISADEVRDAQPAETTDDSGEINTKRHQHEK